MKAKQHIVITKDDHRRLEDLFFSDFGRAFRDASYLRALRGELNIARVVEAEQVPHDVITMNSVVRLQEAGGGEAEVFTLVFPEEANIAEGKLSVLAPIGTAILGYRVGDTVCWEVPGGTAKMVIEALLFQPERDGVVA
ncbi:nucleoside diphosphate kinase regulator [Pirellulimonas nuda]|nr:nucleoside diphosphate kinase regulator [Pirellulimonas nuda]